MSLPGNLWRKKLVKSSGTFHAYCIESPTMCADHDSHQESFLLGAPFNNRRSAVSRDRHWDGKSPSTTPLIKFSLNVNRWETQRREPNNRSLSSSSSKIGFQFRRCLNCVWLEIFLFLSSSILLTCSSTQLSFFATQRHSLRPRLFSPASFLLSTN